MIKHFDTCEEMNAFLEIILEDDIIEVCTTEICTSDPEIFVEYVISDLKKVQDWINEK